MKPYTLEQAEADLRTAIDDGDEAAVRALESVIDRLDQRPAPVGLLAAALWYAEQGLRVFPLQQHDAVEVDPRTGEIEPAPKRPYRGSRGFLDATTDAQTIRDWWCEKPESNIGIATGHLVDVIDIDGPVGVKSYVQLLDDLPPVLGKVSTPRPGGTHLYVPAVPGRRNRAKLLPGIDYRGTGGYVVAPPSRVSVGDYHGTYTWRTPLDIAALKEIAA